MKQGTQGAVSKFLQVATVLCCIDVSLLINRNLWKNWPFKTYTFDFTVKLRTKQKARRLIPKATRPNEFTFFTQKLEFG